MGRMPMGIFEILALAWDHPLIAGMLMLMFTPPFFPVLVFFSPLLISTALCAVALISMGQQFEDGSKREREVAGWNARGVGDGDHPSARERTIRRRRAPGEENWLDWVRGGLEPGSMWGHTESSSTSPSSMLIEDVKEDRLLADFRIDEGGIDMKEEDYRLQIEAFREFESRNLGERSFSFRTGAAVAATIEALDSPDGDSSMRIVPFHTTPVQSPSPQIPPMFLYTLKTGGTGTGPTAAATTTATTTGVGVDVGNASGNLPEEVSGVQRPAHRRRQLPHSDHHQQQKSLVAFGSGFFSGSFDEVESVDQPQPQPQQQQQNTLVSFGSGFISGTVEEPKKDKEHQQLPHHHQPQLPHHPYQHPQQHQKQLVAFGGGFPSSAPVEPKKEKQEQQQQYQQQRQGALIPFGSGFISGNFREVENSNHDQQQQQQQQQQELLLQLPRSSSRHMHVSSAEPAHSPKSLTKSSSSSSTTAQNPIKSSSYVESRESEQRKASIFDLGGSRGDRMDSRDSKPKYSHERSRNHTNNAGLIPGNAVIYTAEPPPIDTKQLQRRNSLSNRDRRGASTTTSRQKRKHGMAARHALLMEKENSITGNWISPTTTNNAAR